MSDKITIDKEVMIRVLGSPIAYYTDFAKALGDALAGIFVSQMFYWHGKGADKDGWIYKTQQEIYEETGLTRRNQEAARKKAVKLDVLEEKRQGLPSKLYFRLDLGKLFELVAAGDRPMWVDVEKSKKNLEARDKSDDDGAGDDSMSELDRQGCLIQTSLGIQEDQGCLNQTDKGVCIRQTSLSDSDNDSIYTEITTEITSSLADDDDSQASVTDEVIAEAKANRELTKDEVKAITATYEKCAGNLITAYISEQYQDLAKDYGTEAVIRGLMAAAENHKAQKFQYVKACIVNIATGNTDWKAQAQGNGTGNRARVDREYKAADKKSDQPLFVEDPEWAKDLFN